LIAAHFLVHLKSSKRSVFGDIHYFESPSLLAFPHRQNFTQIGLTGVDQVAGDRCFFP